MSENQFRALWDLGFRRLLPIVPPGAPIHEKSTLFQRIGTSQDGRGKVPGVRRADGNWSSFDWKTYEADEHDLDRWHAMGAGVGIKTGNQGDGTSLIAIDADTDNVEFAKLIRDHVDAAFGKLCARVGRAPRALYLARITGTMRYSLLEFGPNLAQEGPRSKFERVEVLTDDKQFVAAGIHPKTGKPYSWPRPLAPYADLPIVGDENAIATLLENLRAALPEAQKVARSGSSAEVSQASLTGPLEAVRKAVEATPNNSNMFPSRESYRDFGYAIKAALPDHPEEAFELFSEWCAKWTGPNGEVNDPDVVAADWRRMRGPFRRGASWLYELAERYGDGFSRALVYWEPPADPEIYLDFFPEQQAEKRDDVYPLLRVDDIVSRKPPRFLIDRHIPEVSLGFLYSTPGAGKSFLTLDMALSIAAGLETWHGDGVYAGEDTAVVYIAAEGAYGFRNRIKAWMKAHGVESSPNRFLMIEKTINFMKADDVEKLVRTVRSIPDLRACLVIVDTVSRALPGSDENLQKEMSLFVQACDKIKEAFKCSVLGVHHAGKNGDMRGSTVLLGAGDFVFKLERKKGATIGALICEKQKDGPDGWSDAYRFDQVNLDDGQTSLVPARAETGFGLASEMTPATARQVLAAMGEAWQAGEPWAGSHVAKDRYAVKRMVADFGFEAAQAESLISVWAQSGLIALGVAPGRGRKKGYKVVGGISEGVAFDEAFADVFN